jgi:type IV pilus assembly protein PilB
MVRLKKRLGKILVEAGIVSEEEIQEALESQNGRSLVRTLVELGYAKEEDIAKAIAKATGLSYVKLSDYEVDPAATALIPEEMARRYSMIPIKIDGGNLIVAMADPSNVFAVDDLRIITGYEIKPVVATESEVNNVINQFARMDQDVEAMMESVEGEEVEAAPVEVEEEVEDEDAPIVKLVNYVLTEAVRSRAADVHIEPQEDDLRIRYRIDGVLHEVMRSPKKIQLGMITRLKIMANMDIAERRLPQDGRFSLIVDGRPIDFRVASLPTIHGEKIVLRLLEKESIMMTLEQLGFSEGTLKRFKGSLSKPYGAIFVTGPTGSGKTTTLYAALNILNSIEKNIITVEDPVEYRLSGVAQVQVNPKAGLTFAAALRSILRNDPDIVMIGEIRDQETALIAIESALTGHLVLSTLHTNDAPSAITRLTEMGLETFLISSAVDCIVCQRLARLLCPKCKEPYTPSLEALKRVGFPLEEGEEIPVLYRPKGCDYCSQTGYRGRTGVFEVMLMSEEVERLTVERASTEEIRKVAVSEGMKTLREEGLLKVKAGVTSIEEIMRVIV